MQNNSYKDILKKDIVKIQSLTLIPHITSARAQKFTSIVLTLLALSFFGIFAINPTISTILKLRKEITDNEFVFTELEKKIANLGNLRKQYSSVEKDLPTIIEALPHKPDVPILAAQIQGAARNSNVHIKRFQNFEVEIVKNNQSPKKDYYSYTFSLSGTGTYLSISQFISTLTNMQRIINIDTLSITKSTTANDPSLTFNMQAIAYFKE